MSATSGVRKPSSPRRWCASRIRATCSKGACRSPTATRRVRGRPSGAPSGASSGRRSASAFSIAARTFAFMRASVERRELLDDELELAAVELAEALRQEAHVRALDDRGGELERELGVGERGREGLRLDRHVVLRDLLAAVEVRAPLAPHEERLDLGARERGLRV